ncbi:E3 ubiquitin-protein ligase [Dirofilaria immitis]
MRCTQYAMAINIYGTMNRPDESDMEDIIGSCVICAQNLCVDNFSSLPCGHTFHYKCILRWLCCSEQCPTCRACTSPRNIVKRLYFARCSDRAMNGIESSTVSAKHNNKFAPSMNENALSTGTPENFNGNRHGNDESCNTIIDYESDSEGSGEQEWAMSVIGDGDSTNGNNTSVIALERSESIVRSEAEGEEELEYHETISNADMATFDASFSDTSSLSLGTLSELFSEIDAVSISSMNHNNMETSNSSDDHEEFNDDSGNTYTSLLLIEHGSNDDHDNSSNDNNSSDSEESDDNDSSDSDKSDDSSDDCGLSEYGHFDHLAVDVRIFNQRIS